MNFKWKIFLIAGLITLLFTACGNEEPVEQEEEDSVNVEVAEVNGIEYTDYITVVGTIKPVNKASISHEAGGIIDRYLKDKGDWVKEGDTLLILENSVLKANLLAAEAQYRLAEVNFEKQEIIYKDNVSSEFEYLNAKYNKEQLKAVYEQTLALYNKTFITAPFNGIFDAKYFETGELVPPATPVIEVISISSLKVEAGIPEKFAGRIKNGLKALVYINEVYEEPVESKVSFIGKALSPLNRTFPVEIRIPNKNGSAKPEMIAGVKIAKDTYDNIIIVPEEVITRTDDGYTVFVAEENIAKLRHIKILSRNGADVAVLDGLKNGDKLITLGFQNLVDGEKVNIVN